MGRKSLSGPRLEVVRAWLEDCYRVYHRTRWIGSDPIQFIYRFSNDNDREIVGLIASSLAYGNVAAINASVTRALGLMSDQPYRFLVGEDERGIRNACEGFRHRWTGPDSLASLLIGIRRVVTEYGSLGSGFLAVDEGARDVSGTLSRWTALLTRGMPEIRKNLLSDPERGSACKRLHLYMRWMVRKDEVDPGCWRGISPSRLLVPLDTHVYRFAVSTGLTRRKAADRKTVEEITDAFRYLCPADPVKYDFSLTRPGIVDGWAPDRKKGVRRVLGGMPAKEDETGPE